MLHHRYLAKVRGRGMVLIYFKDYNTTTQVSGKKIKFRRLAPQKTENGTFPGKIIKNHKFHVRKVTSEKITESIVILFYIISD